MLPSRVSIAILGGVHIISSLFYPWPVFNPILAHLQLIFIMEYFHELPPPSQLFVNFVVELSNQATNHSINNWWEGPSLYYFLFSISLPSRSHTPSPTLPPLSFYLSYVLLFISLSYSVLNVSPNLPFTVSVWDEKTIAIFGDSPLIFPFMEVRSKLARK